MIAHIFFIYVFTLTYDYFYDYPYFDTFGKNKNRIELRTKYYKDYYILRWLKE